MASEKLNTKPIKMILKPKKYPFPEVSILLLCPSARFYAEGEALEERPIRLWASREIDQDVSIIQNAF